MLPPGQKIGNRYQIDRLLGQGGMSNLYLARDFQFGDAVRVIKEMTARYADPNEQKLAEQLFMREAQLLATLNHPNIPKVYDKFMFQGKYYLSMDYVQGDDLGKRIQTQGKLPEPEVASYGAQMATVLYYLHRQNPPIVFRDVKPSNIMITAPPSGQAALGQQVKLIDFGIARLFTSAKKGDTMRIGSPGYAPPEQYSGQTDPRSDIYALGVTMHHALTGHDPTVSQTPFLLPPARQLNPSLSPEMVAILERSTQLDPDKRYPSMLEVKRDLQNVMRSHGMVVPGSSMPLNAQTVSAVTNQPAGVASTPLSPSAAPAVSTTTATPSTVAKPPSKRGGGRFLLAALVLLVGGGAAAVKVTGSNPALLAGQAQQWLNPTLPSDPGAAGRQLYRQGGPLPLALDLLSKGLTETPGSSETRIDWANAVVASSSGLPWRLAVLLPEGGASRTMLRGMAMAQQSLNAQGGVEQRPVVLDWETYASGKLAGAVNGAAAGRLSRRTGAEKRPDAVLVCCDKDSWAKLERPKLPCYRVGLEPGATAGHNELPLPPADWKEMLAQVQPGEPVWLAKTPPAPSSIKGSSLPGGAEELAHLIEGQSGRPCVVDPAQLPALLKSPVKGTPLKLIVVADDPSALPKLEEKPESLKGLTLQALVPGSRFEKDPLPASFYGQRLLYLSRGGTASPPLEPAPANGNDGPETYDLACRRMFDGVAWTAAQVAGSSAPFPGVTVRIASEGKVRPARFSLFQWNGSWAFVKEVEGSKS